MILTAVRVRDYKCANDTGTVAIEPAVTCLVGKNESGKTAFLEALYRLHPIPSGPPTEFRELYDYPRQRRAADQAKIAEATPVTATFRLEPADREALEARLGRGVVKSDEVRVARGYDNRLSWQIELVERAAVRHLASAAGVPKSSLRGVTRFDRLHDKLRRTPERGEAEERLLARLEGFDPAAEAEAVLAARLPYFLYFDEYHILPGRFSVPYLQQTPEESLTHSERTALAFLRLAGVDGEDFVDGEYEARKAALEGAAHQLSDEIFGLWSQDRQLRVGLDLDFRSPAGARHEALRVDFDREPEPPVRIREIPPFLEIRIWNERHRLSLNFGERSSGFVWFFSFLAYFSGFRRDERQIVLLLDEPGRNLHAHAQHDLLRFIHDRLAERHQVLYATHSPFLIEAGQLAQVRTVHDDGERGTRIRGSLLGVDRDTLFPLRAAAAWDLAGSLAVGRHNLVVPKASDVLYLRLLSAHLGAKGRTALDPRWVPVPAGGLRKAAVLSALANEDERFAVVLDTTNPEDRKVEGLVRDGLWEAGRLFSLNDLTGKAESEIEDLFDASFFLALLRDAGVADVKPRGLSSEEPVLRAVAEKLERPVDSYRVALHLLREPEAWLGKLSAKALKRFETLFERINEALDAADDTIGVGLP